MTLKFTEFITELEKCDDGDPAANPKFCVCDIGISAWSMSEDRFGRVTYLPAYLRDQLTVVTNINNTYVGSSGAFFVNNFTWSVWVAIAGLFVCWSIVKLFDRRFVPVKDDVEPLPRGASRYKRTKHKFLKSRWSRRIRKSLQSTCALSYVPIE